MKVTKVEHIGIAVRSIEEARAFYEQGLGLTLARLEEVEREGVRVAFLSAGESEIELLEPLGEGGSVARFLESRGEGIHHLCLEVDNIEEAMARLSAQGFRLLDEKPRLGADGKRVAFVHPRSAHGVLLELAEKV